MSAANPEALPTIDHKPHAAFFRQSGWLMIAGVVGGALTFFVHFLNKRISDSEYSAFGVLLMVASCVPNMPLQMVFAQQTAQALATGRKRQLGGMIRLAWLWTFILWAVASLVVMGFEKQIAQRWQMPGVNGILVTLPLLLASLWMPLFSGVLQGRQDFFWLGWGTMLGGVGRVALAFFFVLALHYGAAGMMAGALFGVGLTAAIAIWRSRDLWLLPAEAYDRKMLLRQILPLALGFGAFQFMLTSDTMFTKAYFSGDAMKPYVLAGTLARALLWLVLPLAAVMFPKIVHSNASQQKNNLFSLVLLGTAILSICGALGLCILGPWIVKFVASPGDVAGTMALMPWYAWSMVPLTLANVMVNDLMARGRFAVVPFMLVLTVAYGFTLPAMMNHFPGQLAVPIQTLGAFNVLLLAVCSWFIWGGGKEKPKPTVPGEDALFPSV